MLKLPSSPGCATRRPDTKACRFPEGKANAGKSGECWPGERIYRGIGVRMRRTLDDVEAKKLGCTPDKDSIPSENGVESLSLSGQSRHLDCFVQLFEEKNDEIGNDKVVENIGNARTAWTQPPDDDSGGEKLLDRQSRRISMNLRHNYRNGYVVQPTPNDLSIWRVGKEVGGTTRWLEQSGTREWAIAEVKRRLEPKPIGNLCKKLHRLNS